MGNFWTDEDEGKGNSTCKGTEARKLRVCLAFSNSTMHLQFPMYYDITRYQFLFIYPP
jgi:hypothetical protein